MTSVDQTLKNLQTFFDTKIREHGAQPKGVDWNSQESQYIRFDQLLWLIRNKSEAFTMLDYGSGYGALATYLKERGYNFRYIGYDMTAAVIEEAQRVFANESNCTFTTDEGALQPVDYVIGSGLFNMKMDTPEDAWHEHMVKTVNRLWELTTRGMAFNALTSYSDKEYTRADLYYPDSKWWFDYAKRNLSRNVALLHDYNLYDFTLIVRK
jgi:hypothetical protein